MHRASGFTLVEMTITVAILALAAAVVIPAVSNITRAELRATSSKVAGLIRSTYDAACLEGQIHRLTFDFEKSRIEVTATSQVLAFEPDSNVLAEAAKMDASTSAFNDLAQALSAEIAEQRAEAGDESEPSAVGALFGINSLAGMGGMADEEAFGEGAGALDLAEGVHLLDVWVQGMDEPQNEGKAYLYFFPHGYTQEALIHIEDDGGRVFTVKVAALTAKTAILAEYVEVKK